MKANFTGIDVPPRSPRSHLTHPPRSPLTHPPRSPSTHPPTVMPLTCLKHRLWATELVPGIGSEGGSVVIEAGPGGLR